MYRQCFLDNGIDVYLLHPRRSMMGNTEERERDGRSNAPRSSDDSDSDLTLSTSSSAESESESESVSEFGAGEAATPISRHGHMRAHLPEYMCDIHRALDSLCGITGTRVVACSHSTGGLW